MGTPIRMKEIHQRRVRTKKLKRLREKYQKAKNESDRTAIFAKVKRVHPGLSKEQFLAPLERQSKAA